MPTECLPSDEILPKIQGSRLGWFPASRIHPFLSGLLSQGIPLKITRDTGAGPDSRVLHPVKVGKENGMLYLETASLRMEFPLEEMIAYRRPDPDISPLARSLHLYHYDGSRAGVLSPVDLGTLDSWNRFLALFCRAA